MSLIQRVTALAQAVAADIKALYTGKAEKEHTHTAAQVSGLGTAATKNVGEADGNVMQVGAFGLGGQASITPNIDSQQHLGWRIIEGYTIGTKPSTYGTVLTTGRKTGGSAYQNFTAFGVPDLQMYGRTIKNGVFTPWRELIHTGNIRSTTGQSTNYPMTQKAVTDAINARGFADASGILTATSGALSNDMSSYLSSKTYAEMRTKLGVVPVNVVQDTGTSTEDVMSQKAVTEAIAAAGGGSSGSVNVVQKDGLSASAVMSQYAVSIALYDVSTLVNISRTYCLEQHAALHALNPATATLPQLITALQSATLLDYEEYLPPPEP